MSVCWRSTEQIVEPRATKFGTDEEKGLGATVIGDGTDLLVLLSVHAPATNQLKMVIPKKGNQQGKMHSIRDIQQGIGEMKDVLLAAYASTGCDTVSAIQANNPDSNFSLQQACHKFDMTRV
ncbi:hypothetical protein AVEN_214535-1 [Araneus ventricosus]|uniref:Uncharacterized protein n=1 Tax=Araneus ventricosus TaxID=182803 RepID=A0A4Y2GGE4_ARAVE|nr:hypothetical protein AVEN_214535-1 [Araneus ventricosus]